MYHVQKVPVMNNDSGTVKSWSLRITGASYSETSYNGHVSTGTSSSSGETLDAKSLAKYKEKGIL